MNLEDLDEHPELQGVALRVDDFTGPEEERWRLLNEGLNRLVYGAPHLRWNVL
jgi:hypothetical protein